MFFKRLFAVLNLVLVIILWENVRFKSNYFIFLDGTTNTMESQTSIWNMFNALPGNIKKIQDSYNKDAHQIYLKEYGPISAIYIAGVGSSQSISFAKQWAESINGHGMEKNAIIAYNFLVKRYSHSIFASTEINIFGFSRGAATARMLCTYLSKYGITNLNFEPSNENPSITKFDATFVNPEIDSVVGTIPTINFLGLFDTVPGLDVHSTAAYYLGSNDLAKLSMDIPSIVRHCAHAVAINEVRTDFKYEPISVTSNWKESYFIGNHDDIGGRRNRDRPQISLRWMITQANMTYIFKSILSSEEVVNDIATNYPIGDSMSLSRIYGGTSNRDIDISKVDQSVQLFAKKNHIQLEEVTNTEALLVLQQ